MQIEKSTIGLIISGLLIVAIVLLALLGGEGAQGYIDVLLGLLAGQQLPNALRIRSGGGTGGGSTLLVVACLVMAPLVVGCGASAKEHAFNAVVGTCDALEEAAVRDGGGDAEQQVACIRLTCDAALRRLDAEAAEELEQ